MAKKTPDTPESITADDLRDKLQGLQGEVQGKVDDKKTTIAKRRRRRGNGPDDPVLPARQALRKKEERNRRDPSYLMALLPYGLQPGRLIRRTALRRGLSGTNIFWSSVAGILLGQGSYVRSQAIRRSLIGGSRSWQVLAGFMIVKEAASSAGKQPEYLGKQRWVWARCCG